MAGVVQVAVPWDHNADILERLGGLLMLGVPLVLGLAALGGWMLIGRTLQPISRIVTEAERLDAAALPDALLPQAAETDSEIGHLVATLNRMTTRLRRAFDAQRRFAEAQQRFAADASHELRTPLTILRGEMELALSRPRAPQQYQETLQSAMQEVARMSRIVEGLGFLARRDAGQMQSNVSRAARGSLCPLPPCRGRVRPQARDREVDLSCELEGSAPAAVPGDADQIQQLLRNLMDNALKYTPRRRPRRGPGLGRSGDADRDGPRHGDRHRARPTCRTSSTASGGPTSPAPAKAAAWASPSVPRSRRPTAGPCTPPASRASAARSASNSPVNPATVGIMTTTPREKENAP